MVRDLIMVTINNLDKIKLYSASEMYTITKLNWKLRNVLGKESERNFMSNSSQNVARAAY